MARNPDGSLLAGLSSPSKTKTKANTKYRLALYTLPPLFASGYDAHPESEAYALNP